MTAKFIRAIEAIILRVGWGVSIFLVLRMNSPPMNDAVFQEIFWKEKQKVVDGSDIPFGRSMYYWYLTTF